MNKLRMTMTLAAVALMGALSMSAQAATFSATGIVTDATGAFAALTPVGTPVGGDIDVDDGAVAGGLAGPGDIPDIGVAVGGFCFTWGAGTCAGSIVPITSIDAASLTFNGAGESTGGLMDVTAFSPTFMLSIPIAFDFTAGTFDAAAAGLGTVSGDIALSPSAVPVPAAAWLFGSALLGLLGLGRRNKA